MDRTREEIELILSDKFSAIQEYRKIFAHRLCTDSPIRIYAPPPNPESVQFVSEEIDVYSLRDDLDVYILSNAEFKKHLYFPHMISVIEIWGDKTVDDFDFNNPGKVLVEPNTENVSENTENDPKKIAYLHDIIINKFPFIQKIIDVFPGEDSFVTLFLGIPLLALFISLILDWIGVVDDYQDGWVFGAIPFLSWFAVMLLIIVFMLITDIPVYIMNRYYENVNSGIGITAAIWKAVYPFVMGAIFLVLYSYIP